MSYQDEREFSVLLGVVLTGVKQIKNEELQFFAADGRSWRLYHEQDCCETVTIDDICGDLNDLIGVPILLAEEVSSSDRPPDIPPEEYQAESETWTFYKLATNRGAVTIRWYGESNGHYSESVTFEEMLHDAA